MLPFRAAGAYVNVILVDYYLDVAARQTNGTPSARAERGRADEAVALIGKLYRIKRERKDDAVGARMLARQQYSVPAMAELHAWMVQPATRPKPSIEGFSSCVGYRLKFDKN